MLENHRKDSVDKGTNKFYLRVGRQYYCSLCVCLCNTWARVLVRIVGLQHVHRRFYCS